MTNNEHPIIILIYSYDVRTDRAGQSCFFILCAPCFFFTRQFKMLFLIQWCFPSIQNALPFSMVFSASLKFSSFSHGVFRQFKMLFLFPWCFPSIKHSLPFSMMFSSSLKWSSFFHSGFCQFQMLFHFPCYFASPLRYFFSWIIQSLPGSLTSVFLMTFQRFS